MENYEIETNHKFGFRQVKPTPSKEVIHQYYADEFYSANYGGQCNNSSLEVQERDAEFLEGNRDDIIDLISRLVGRDLAEVRLLDLGCGWCEFLKHMAAKGVRCTGIDPAPEAIERGKSLGLDVRVGGVEEINAIAGDKRYDVVSLFNVLEHLADPEQTLLEIHKALAPEGLVIIDVPNEFNPLQMAAKKLHNLPEWWVKPPAHLNYFSKDSLCALVSGCGYEVCDVSGSFPLEMFLLMGKNYVEDGALGRECHEMRVAFESNLRRLGFDESLRKIYKALSEAGFGRQVRVAARKTT